MYFYYHKMSYEYIIDNNILTVPSYQQYHIIDNFAQTFERDTGLNIDSCRDIIEDSNSIFYSFSYLIQYLFLKIDTVLPCQSFYIKGLNLPQRRYFYIELAQIGINYTQNSYLDHNGNLCSDMCIPTTNFWSVPDYRTTPDVFGIYQNNISAFNDFYSYIENLFIFRTNSNDYINLSLENFLKFKRIFIDSVSSYNSNYNNTSDQPTGANITKNKSNLSSNYSIKHQLADLIFDIKDNLSDAKYKEILEKISLIST